MKHKLAFLLLLGWVGSACKKTPDIKTESEVECTCLDLAKEIQGSYTIDHVQYQRNQLKGNYNPADSVEQGKVQITKVDPLRVKLTLSVTTKSGTTKLSSEYQAELSRDITPGKEGQILLNGGGSFTSVDRKQLYLTVSPSQEQYGQLAIQASR